MRIHTKLLIGFIAPLLIVSILSLVGFFWTRSLFIESREISFNKVRSTLSIKSNNLELSLYVLNTLLEPNKSYQSDFEKVKVRQLQEMDKLKKLKLSPEESKNVFELEQLLHDSIAIEEQLLISNKIFLQNWDYRNNLIEKKINPMISSWIKNVNQEEHEDTLQNFQIDIYKLVANVRGYLLFNQQELKDKILTNLDKLSTDVNKVSSIPLTNSEFSAENVKRNIDDLVISFKGAIDLLNKKFDLINEDNNKTLLIDQRVTNLYHLALNDSISIANKINQLNLVIMIIIIFTIILAIVSSALFASHVVKPIEELIEIIRRIRAGENVTVTRTSADEVGNLALAFKDLIEENKQRTAEMNDQSWLNQNLSEILKSIQGDVNLKSMADKVITTTAELIQAGCGAFYVLKNDLLILVGTYGYKKRKNLSNKFALGESLVGQAALEGKSILLNDLPDEYIHITSGLGENPPKTIIVLPLLINQKALGVIELALFKELSSIQQQFLEQLSNNLGVVIESINSREATEIALSQVKKASEELQTQQEELRTANEELEEKTHILQQSEEELKTQSEELQTSNEELEEKMKAIEQQKAEIENKNKLLEDVKKDLEEKAQALARSGKYKTEFLSNMSHELRTPLNSLLLLAKSFASNADGNLTPQQIEQANIIYKGGKDLLQLINDILDLSKVEAGKLNIHIEEVEIKTITEDLKRQFDPLVKENELEFIIEVDPSINKIKTDATRVKQILRNLISNAFKFTQHGYVKLEINPLKNDPTKIAYKVIDTGIGIEKSKFNDIFVAFQQAYGDTDRRYGGTGLGLTISRELAKLLGGEIQLESEVNKGSTFTLILPITPESSEKHQITEKQLDPVEKQPLIDNQKDSNKHTMLIMLNDKKLMDIVTEAINKKENPYLLINDPDEAYSVAKKNQPIGIIFGFSLEDSKNSDLLKKLQTNDATRDIPIHLISDKNVKEISKDLNKIHFIPSPKNTEDFKKIINSIFKNQNVHIKLLLVEDDLVTQDAVCKAITAKKINIKAVTTGKEGLTELSENDYDGLILDLKLPDMDGSHFLKLLNEKEIRIPPIIIYSQKDLSQEEFFDLNQYTNKIIRKEGDTSIERLVSECMLFLHAVKKQSNITYVPKKIENLINGLRDKTVLIVDDDMRNVYALSIILQRQQMKILTATNGEEALKKLFNCPGVDIVIMDIMMPVMDGYKTIRAIRKIKQFENIAIIAVTAKAMPEDKKACMDAGANDYITKPIDDDKLLSIMRVWLSTR